MHKIAKIRVLYLNDAQGVERVQEILDQAGLIEPLISTNRLSDFEELLRKRIFDIILSDCKPDDFTCFDALRISNSIASAVPVIFLGEKIGEEKVIELIRAGAADYVLNENLTRLPLAIKRALEESSEKKRIQDALKKSEQRLNEIAGQIPGAIYQFMITADNTWKMLYLSDGAEKIFNKPMDELLNNDEFLADLPKEEHQAFIESVEYSKKYMTSWEREYRVIWSSDQSVHWIQGHSIPHKQPDGSVIWNGVLLDVTEKKLAQKEKEKYQLNYQQLFNSMLDGYALHEIILDDNGKPVDYRFLDINPAFERITGLKREHIVGKTVLDVLPGTESHWIENYGNVALTGQSIHFEQYSQEFDKYFKVSAFQPADLKFACVFIDVTDTVKAKYEREEKIKELTRVNRLMMGRENRMIELKREVNELCDRCSEPRRYNTPDEMIKP